MTSRTHARGETADRRFEAGPPTAPRCTWCANPAPEHALVEGDLVCRRCCEAQDWAEPQGKTWTV